MTPIGVFDSGYGGLTILNEFRQTLPQYDYLYLGDNARAPYGARSFEVVYEFTRQAVNELFRRGCHLVILGCNTASAKALRTIQQVDLLNLKPGNFNVLGIIRPTAEIVGDLTRTRHIGVLATEGTIRSESYSLEINKLHPDIVVSGQACPLWASLVEANELDSEGTDYFVKKRIDQLLAKDPLIDTILLGCTHYPLLINSIRKACPPNIQVVSQGQYVAAALKDYLNRHPELEALCSKNATTRYLTTESIDRFEECAKIFLSEPLNNISDDLHNKIEKVALS